MHSPAIESGDSHPLAIVFETADIFLWPFNDCIRINLGSFISLSVEHHVVWVDGARREWGVAG
jgi:hypothetical protein